MKNNKKGSVGADLIIFLMLIMFIALAFNRITPVTPQSFNEYAVKNTYSICALGGDDKISGNFLSITENNTYLMMRDIDGYTSMDEVPANYTRINEYDPGVDESPRVEVFESKQKNLILGYRTIETYRIHVPKGTITREFKVDVADGVENSSVEDVGDEK